jgi:hypothetical protein
MKRVLFGLVLLISTVSFAATPPVNEKVASRFAETFPAAENAKWYEYESFYEVFFVNNEITCRVTYDLQGNIISARRDYYEKNLSLFIVAKVKEKFPGKKIFGVTEVTTQDGIVYTIVLEDEKNWTTITSNEIGNFNVVQKLRKA